MASGAGQILAGKVALITGASRGIGRAVAASYARHGASIFVCARNPTEVGVAVAELKRDGAEVDGVAGDVGKAEDVEIISTRAIGRFGTIDILVNNASILGPRESIANYPVSEWEQVMRINLTGVFLMTRAVLPAMLARGTGSIINVSSGVGRKGKARWGAYAVSKGGLEILTQVLSDEVKETGIRVNSVNPAATRTQMRAMAYPEEDPLNLPAPEEIVPVFLYLASDASAGVSGQALEARDWVGRAI